MKKMKRFIPIVTVALLLFPMLDVQAAPWKKNQQAPKASLSTLEGTVEMSLEQINSLEGAFKVVKKPDKGAAFVQGVNVICSDKSAQGMTKDDKIFLASSGEPMNVTIGVSLKFTVAGTYVLELDGGVTNAEGVYEDYSEQNESYICRIEIQAGNISSTNNPTNQNSTGGDFNFNTEFDFDINVETEELEEVLGEVADAIKSDEQLAMMQQLLEKMDQGLALLENGNQEAVDATTEELKESLENLELAAETIEDGEQEEKEAAVESEEEAIKTNDGFGLKNIFKYLKWILSILAIVIFGAAAVYFWKKMEDDDDEPDYDGAPMVDYDIEEDDE